MTEHDEIYGKIDLIFSMPGMTEKSQSRFKGIRRMKIENGRVTRIVSYLERIDPGVDGEMTNLVWVDPDKLEQVLNFIETLGGLNID